MYSSSSFGLFFTVFSFQYITFNHIPFEIEMGKEIDPFNMRI